MTDKVGRVFTLALTKVIAIQTGDRLGRPRKCVIMQERTSLACDDRV